MRLHDHDLPPRVLVVDDERGIRELFRRVLLLAGYDVLLAAGGAEGLQLLGRNPDIGLILLDLDMPYIDGSRFRAAQLADPRLAGVPTVVVTGMALTDALRAELHADAYLTKPAPPAQLTATAARYCRAPLAASPNAGSDARPPA
jgi:CheY-like chemotaxis protein